MCWTMRRCNAPPRPSACEAPPPVRGARERRALSAGGCAAVHGSCAPMRRGEARQLGRRARRRIALGWRQPRHRKPRLQIKQTRPSLQTQSQALAVLCWAACTRACSAPAAAITCAHNIRANCWALRLPARGSSAARRAQRSVRATARTCCVSHSRGGAWASASAGRYSAAGQHAATGGAPAAAARARSSRGRSGGGRHTTSSGGGGSGHGAAAVAAPGRSSGRRDAAAHGNRADVISQGGGGAHHCGQHARPGGKGGRHACSES